MKRDKRLIQVRELAAEKHRETSAMVAELVGGKKTQWPVRFQSRGPGDTKKAGKRR